MSQGSPIYVVSEVINKEAAWAYDRVEENKVGIPCRDRGEKKAESETCHVAEGDRLPGALRVNHEPSGNTQNNKNGLI